MRKRKLDAILNAEEVSVNEKYTKMQHEVQKLTEKFKQKEELARYNRDEESQEQAAELLLSSIRAKMGIMNLLKKNNEINDDEDD